jgi:hypothetical protein
LAMSETAKGLGETREFGSIRSATANSIISFLSLASTCSSAIFSMTVDCCHRQCGLGLLNRTARAGMTCTGLEIASVTKNKTRLDTSQLSLFQIPIVHRCAKKGIIDYEPYIPILLAISEKAQE